MPLEEDMKIITVEMDVSTGGEQLLYEWDAPGAVLDDLALRNLLGEKLTKSAGFGVIFEVACATNTETPRNIIAEATSVRLQSNAIRAHLKLREDVPGAGYETSFTSMPATATAKAQLFGTITVPYPDPGKKCLVDVVCREM